MRTHLERILISNSIKDNILKVKITPNSSKNEITEVDKEGVVKIRIKAVPENNKANEELIKFLKKNNIKAEIVKGKKSRVKTLKVLA